MIDLQKNHPLLTPLALFLGCAVIAVAVYSGRGMSGGSDQSVALDRFAQCLTEKGATLYAASTCGYCKQQKELFGESLQYLDAVECYDSSAGGWTDACREAGLQGVPTWVLSDGSSLVGLQALEELAEKTGCPLE
jgi:hypothetical protein